MRAWLDLRALGLICSFPDRIWRNAVLVAWLRRDGLTAAPSFPPPLPSLCWALTRPLGGGGVPAEVPASRGGARSRAGEAGSDLVRGDGGMGGGGGIYSTLVKVRHRRRSAGRCFWLAQSRGGGSWERMEKSKSGLVPASKGDASCSFLRRFLCWKLCRCATFQQVPVDDRCYRKLFGESCPALCWCRHW